ncbi:MAG: hypothetical protein KA314_17610 [Chloroflexi bacterium]|nr:hypothetical protein [Chloroflexota bacterium]MBP8057649.1 hypothetical protein [Chloroflexota bacterium]
MSRQILFTSVLVLFLLSCGLSSSAINNPPTEFPTPSPHSHTNHLETPAITDLPQPANPTRLLQPDELIYQGAFLLPPGDAWDYSGYAMTYFPGGDPDGSEDGFPGSLFVLGHDHQQMVAEITIPIPVITTDAAALNTAITLQPFADITGGMFGEMEIPRAGLAYLPPIGAQSSGKLYFTWGQHFQFEATPSHGWAELDLSNPDPAGPWFVGEYTNYVLNDYLFEIPEDWAATYVSGLRLATGRFRDGRWGGLGPALFAIAPWLEGNPPTAYTRLNQVVPLLLYGENVPGSPEIDVSQGFQMVGYAEPDEWSGGAWLTHDEKSALVFVGTKAMGRTWYGFSNGVEYPTGSDPNEVYPEVPPWPHDERGWWSEDIQAQIIFFNPDDLAAVAQGHMASWEPQPYAVLELTDFLFSPGFDFENHKHHLMGDVAFDRDNGLLYLIERRALPKGESVVHVFKIGAR